jgi:hypothetical protein
MIGSVLANVLGSGWLANPLAAARSIPLGQIDCQPASLKINKKRTEDFSFNHGVVGSSPTALTKKLLCCKGLFNSTTQGTTRKTHLGSVWVVG